ncbi:MAG: 4-phosphoerythronate dehydrogenase PdxB [Bacteroidales bacterium]|nr:4-phosphoerythronate dehydrogenase PdxB [Bacteroidales bacterium]
MNKINIVADSKIPFLKGILEPFANIEYLSPNEIDKDAVKNADALIIRTRTHCNKSLLEGSKVKMIATATIGFDHIDRKYCNENNITWKNAPGCNADGVAQYIIGVLALLNKIKGFQFDGKTIGIIGVGNVGKRVEKACISLGLKILKCDPPRANQEGKNDFCDLKTIAEKADIITFHTPITRDGEYPTFHLAEKDFFNSLKRNPVIINAARGGVVDEEAMLEAFSNNLIDEIIVDCWENEPDINSELLKKAFITTPHIAGYSADGKSNATIMAVKNIAEFFGFEIDTTSIKPKQPENPIIDVSIINKQILENNQTDNFNRGNSIDDLIFDEVILKSYNPEFDSNRLRTDPSSFEEQRGNYPFRREYKAYTIMCMPDNKYKEMSKKLGFNV